MNNQDFESIVKLQRGIESSIKSSLSYYNTFDYEKTRKYVLSKTEYNDYIPELLKNNRTLNECKADLKSKNIFQDNQLKYLYFEFKPLLDYLEFEKPKQIQLHINFDETYIQTEWNKCNDRKVKDPKGAITSARTLLESTLKFILAYYEIEFQDSADLIDLYKLVSKKLSIAPQKEHEEYIKQILSGTHSIVQGIGTMRNKISDAHAQKPGSIFPIFIYSEFAVNIAGTTAMFLYRTHKETKEE